MDNTVDMCGKKIFFLYPQTVIKNEVASDLIMEEYEVYTVRDHTGLHRVLKRFPNSILFVNIEEKMKEKEWEAWILEVMNDPETGQTAIGVLASARNEDLEKKFFTQLKLACGFIQVSTDIKKLFLQLVEILKSQDAMGRRKYLRVTTENEKTPPTVNIPFDGHFLNGTVKDISSAGFSCTFPNDPSFVKGSLISNIQLKLQSSLMRAEAIVFGSRMDETRMYVFLFTPHTDTEIKLKIRKYIQSVIQSKMEIELKKR